MTERNRCSNENLFLAKLVRNIQIQFCQHELSTFFIAKAVKEAQCPILHLKSSNQLDYHAGEKEGGGWDGARWRRSP